MDDNNIKNLGEYQWKWLNKYNSIKLSEWRYECINNKCDWFYIGNWKPTKWEPYPSKYDGGYSERRNNLENNRYFYWPNKQQE